VDSRQGIKQETNSLATSEASCTLSSVIVKPAKEKTCSDGADVAGMLNICAAKMNNSLYFHSFYFHHNRGN